MTNLSTLKKEAKSDYRDGPVTLCSCPDHMRDMELFLDTLIDKVVEAVEESVMPSKTGGVHTWAEGFNTSIEEMRIRFTNFRK